MLLLEIPNKIPQGAGQNGLQASRRPSVFLWPVSVFLAGQKKHLALFVLFFEIRQTAPKPAGGRVFFRPLVFFSTGPGQIQAIIVNPSQTGFRPVEKNSRHFLI